MLHADILGPKIYRYISSQMISGNSHLDVFFLFAPVKMGHFLPMLCRWPEASFDNMAAQMLSQTLKRKKYETWAPIKKWDFQGPAIGNLPLLGVPENTWMIQL